jgi:hypothetical protein
MFPNNRSAMLSNDDHSGLIAFVFGLIVVVFAGIGLSLAVDRRFSFSSSAVALEMEIKSNESELEYLKGVHRERSADLTELESKSKMAAAAMTVGQKRATDLERRRTILIAERESLGASTRLLEEEFKRYRMKYRESARDAAIGESLGEIVTRDGREYREVFISSVTGVGLEIRHAHGTARLSAADLDPSFQDRFQWDDEERRALLSEEMGSAKANEDIPETTKAPGKPCSKPDEARSDPQKVQMLRGKLIAWRSKVSQLRSDRSRALSLSYSSQASPPGSLETWRAKAARLGGEIARAEAELAAAKAALASVSPDDELLRSRSSDR